jgi:hypothetical protein
MSLIKPTVGRVVLLMVGAAAMPGFARPAAGEPCAALVTRVWGDRCINVAAFDANGACFGLTSVRLLQGDDVAAEGEMHAKWMDYQKGQAAKAEQLEAKLSTAPQPPVDNAHVAPGCEKFSEAAIEAEIQAKGLTAPRLSPADLDAAIVHTEIVKHVSPSGQVLRWAVLTTRNGFAVTGRPSASVSPENDNADIGEKVAIDNARSELWPLLGYALRERLAAA